MRIIAGIYKGRHLKSPPSLDIRPTSDRLRETLFNILAPYIDEVRFLDLCAGSGAVGIEALSRGAAHATFVDRSRKMCGLIEANLDLCRVPEEQTEIFNMEAADFLRFAVAKRLQTWDLVFFDPPYKQDYANVLELLGTNVEDLLKDDALIVVEHHHKNRLPGIIGDLKQSRVVKQGDSSLSFYRVQE
ncbi:MAG: 16S rRNA (guanine(966)-N(2))-methyltransferase RsmD [Blastocatellia bacterium]|nr:MAG: 16S rRNA (guanine(966)-N(2))-methyltransferase RsmD [Blastocatellia bacterium]